MIAGVRPSLPKTEVQGFQYTWKYLLEVVNHVAPFFGDYRLRPQHFAGAPQPFQRDFDFVAYGLLLKRRPHLIFTPDNQTVKGSVLVENGKALGLGRVSCQNRFNPYFF